MTSAATAVEATAYERNTTVGLRVPRPRTLILVALGIASLAAVIVAGGALGPYVVGYVYIVAAYPAVQALARRGMPRWAAIIAVFGLTILVAVGFLAFVAGFMSQSTTFMASTQRWLSDGVHYLLDQLASAGTTHPGDAAAFYGVVQELTTRITAGILAVISPPGSGPLGLIGTILAFGTVPFWAFYLMKDWPKLSESLDRRLPGPWAPDARVLMSLAGSSFANWIRGQLIASAVAAAFTFIEFEILGLTIDPVFSDVAFVMAAVAFVFELVPTVGPTIALIPYLIVGAAAGVVGMAAVFVGWVIAQQLENAWIVPRVQSRATDLHPAVILTVLVIGGAIHGLLGVILAVPVTSALWRIADYYLPMGDRRPVESAEVDGSRASVPAAASDSRIGGRPAIDAA
jgi:predicted PurR-regulated permease PerM